MVRTFQKENTRPATAAIVGGFVSIPVSQVLALWFVTQGLELGIGEFRAWLAAIEMVKRRSFHHQDHCPAYGFAELARLLDVNHARARLLVRNLDAAGLLHWSESAITFPEPPTIPEELLGPFAETIGRGKGSIVLPRTLLRFLAGGASTATIAVALAALFRCLSCRRGCPDGWGRLKASWIARAFRIGERQVVDARKQLVDLGWLAVEGDNRQGAMNRWGRAYRINLAWELPARTLARSAPPRPAPLARSAPPLLDRNPLPEEEIQNQNPASGGPAGIQLSEGEGEMKTPAPTSIVSTTPAPPRSSPAAPAPVPSPGGLPTPRLEDVRLEDLKDTERLLNLLGQAVSRGLVNSSEADRLRFVGAAEHALGIGQENPAGLFLYLVRGKLWRYLTQEDEDRAIRRIKAFLRGPEPPRLMSSSFRQAVSPVLSEDARMVCEYRRALASAGYRGDPFPQVRRHDPSWTRERWDAALLELGT